jgi:hypothetical protein
VREDFSRLDPNRSKLKIQPTMKKIFVMTMLFFLAGERLPAELPPDTKSSVGGGSRTLLEIQLRDIMQDMRPANREIAILKEYHQKLAEIPKKIDDAKTPVKPKVFEEFTKAFDELKNLKGDTVLDSTANLVVKTFLDKYSVLSGTISPILPREIFAAVSRSREDATISPILESVESSNTRHTYRTEKISELVNSIAKFDDEKWVVNSPSPSRQKIDGEIQAASAEVMGLGKQFEDDYGAMKISVKEYYTKLASAVAAEITRREALVAQQVKSTEELAKQIAELEKAQSLNVGDLIQKLPILVGILCGLFVGLILLIRFYPPELQTEWVASGQVIQLLTVVTLLLIILCLAVTHVINENTIGTLLGGIGGYVLSQGIGRAAAREATRAKPPGGPQ